MGHWARCGEIGEIGLFRTLFDLQMVFWPPHRSVAALLRKSPGDLVVRSPEGPVAAHQEVGHVAALAHLVHRLREQHLQEKIVHLHTGAAALGAKPRRLRWVGGEPSRSRGTCARRRSRRHPSGRCTGCTSRRRTPPPAARAASRRPGGSAAGRCRRQGRRWPKLPPPRPPPAGRRFRSR